MDLPVLIAAAADVCSKPNRHSVIPVDSSISESDSIDFDDLHVRIESRDSDGVRHPEMDLELEIYRSGNDLNVMIAWWDQPERPLLWQGQHPVWMEPDSGCRCQAPEDGQALEALARRIRALLCGRNP